MYTNVSSTVVLAQTMANADLHSRLTHPRIVQLHDTVSSDDHQLPVQIMELCTGPDLDTFLKKEGPLDEKRARLLIR